MYTHLLRLVLLYSMWMGLVLVYHVTLRGGKIMNKVQCGKLIYSNCGFKHDVMFGTIPARHLFWRFWWSVSK